MSDELADVTRKLGRAYRAWKDGEKEKNKLRDKFFEHVTKELEQQVPAQSVQEIDAGSEEEALRIAQRRFVRHKVVSLDGGDGSYRVLLEEDPSLRPFTWINPSDGQVYSRVISEGSPLLDDEAIKDEDPELWNRITREVTTRELKPLEELSPEDAAAIQPYITLPKPQVKLGAPRKAKPEELDDA